MDSAQTAENMDAAQTAEKKIDGMDNKISKKGIYGKQPAQPAGTVELQRGGGNGQKNDAVGKQFAGKVECTTERMICKNIGQD